MAYEFRVRDQIHHVTPVYRSGKVDLAFDGEVYTVGLEALGACECQIQVGTEQTPLRMCRVGDQVYVHIDGYELEISLVNRLDRLRREAEATAGVDEIKAPMPGIVVEMRVGVGDSVEVGDVLIVIESMKLHLELGATRAGRVAELPRRPGDTFDQGAILARISPAGTELPP